MHTATKKIRVGLPALAMAMALLFVTAPVGAQGPGPFVIDHYFVYDVINPVFGSFPVRLTDQFLTSDNEAVFQPRFAVPVDKNGEGVLDPDLHYSWWGIGGDQSNPIPLVAVENQFGAQTLDVGTAHFLLNPALKNSQPGEVPPPGRDHYKCYSATGNPVGLTVNLSEQFRTDVTNVLEPLFLCNPVEKSLPDGTVYPVSNPDEHLVCYQVTPLPNLSLTVGILDQFMDVTGAELGDPQLICVPSTKEIPTQISEESWGKVKAIYR